MSPRDVRKSQAEPAQYEVFFESPWNARLKNDDFHKNWWNF